MNSSDLQKTSPMRSLYIDDIPGTRPVKRAFDKSTFNAKHNEQMHRFRNPQQRVIDWYLPTKKILQPMEKTGDQQWITKRTLQNSFKIHTQEMSNSMPIRQLIDKEGLNSPPPSLSKSSILSGSALQSLKKTSDNPYFPHRYVDQKTGEINKWSGQRSWIEEPTQFIKVNSTKDSYFRKWN